MRISSDQLSARLKQGLAPLYTVFGDAPLLALEAADRIRAEARAQDYAERVVLTAEQHFDWSRLKSEAVSQSLFAARRILELRIPSGKPGVEGGKALQAFCAALPAETLTLVQLPALDWRAQKAAWFEALESAGTSVEAAQVPRAALPRWLAGRLQAQGQQADDAALEFLADRVEGNLLAAHQEIQKLGLVYPAGALSAEQVESAVLDVARYDVFDLGTLLLAGDAAHLARALEGLRAEGAAAPLVLWTLTEEVRALARVVSLMSSGRPLAQALREARVWGPRQKAIERHAPRLRAAQLEAALLHAARIDRMIKGLARGDPWEEFMRLGLRFSNAGTGARPQRTRA